MFPPAGAVCTGADPPPAPVPPTAYGLPPSSLPGSSRQIATVITITVTPDESAHIPQGSETHPHQAPSHIDSISVVTVITTTFGQVGGGGIPAAGRVLTSCIMHL